MADGLDVVAVGIEDEGTVVVLVIHRTRARATVVAATSAHRSLEERVHRCTILRGERDVSRIHRER